MQIAICDDEQIFRNELSRTINSVTLTDSNFVTYEFQSGIELLESYRQQNNFDIIFLDIEMPQISGLEVAQRIRKVDNNVIIIFCTAFKQFVFDTFQIEAFDYLVKPIHIDKVKSVLSRAYNKYQDQHQIVKLKWQDDLYILEINEIIYIEGYHRHTMFYTANNKYECVGKLNDYDNILSPYGFLKCHQGYLINMSYIKSIENASIIMTTGKSVDMSVRKKQNCLKSFNEYLMRYKV